MRRCMVTALAMAFIGLAGPAWADKPGPSGTWKWTVIRGGKKLEATVKLEFKGDRVTGVMIRRNGEELPVVDGTYKDGTVSFRVPGKTPDGKDMVHCYSGTLEGDTIKGTSQIVLPDQTHTSKWEARRARD